MKIGILGGTFDPPHFGHLNLAEETKLRLNLDKVFFVPAHQSPHKFPQECSPPTVRYRMTRLAVRNRPGFEVSDAELRRAPPSYTVETLKTFRESYPYPHELYLLVGSDSIETLDTWKDFHLICEMCCFVVATRPGYVSKRIPEDALKLEIDEMDISSSEIRRMIRAGEDVNDLVPYRVLQLIEKEALYR